ncbi:SatD family protein [Paeniglutamicibacter sp. NPDC012692]|uniref:SatD family protein n=1 Tax=Paeniglutamicibacter sp. NPDC012692 TaxID=3364388 RepID=UPI003699B7AF
MRSIDVVFPVIMDIVDSRKLADRESAQAAIESVCAVVERQLPALQPWQATVGDEFQAVYPTLHEALCATTLLRLSLPADIDCRFGIGRGSIQPVSSISAARIQDGSGWWAARAAIDEARQREKARNPTLRSWFQSSGAGDEQTAVTNAYLLTRDQLISSLNPKTRRYASGLLLGQTQSSIARAEGVTQSAVSQALKNSGAGTLIAAMELLDTAPEPRTRVQR